MYNNGKPNQPPYLISAYGIWLRQGNSGTEEDFINSLKGDPGEYPRMQFDAETGYLQIRYNDDGEWTDIASLEDLMTEDEAAVIAAAKEYSDLAEAYAKGTVDGEPVPSGDPGYHDNAKYYAGQAESQATAAANHANNAESSTQAAIQAAYNAATSASAAQDSAVSASASSYNAASSASNAALSAGSSATSAQAAADSASGAATSAYNADQAAQSAANYASAANSALGTILAVENAVEDTAANVSAYVEAAAAAQTAAEAAQTAAETAETHAETAQDKAEDAQEAAETAQAAAEAVLESIPEDYSELSSDVADLKSAMNDISEETDYTTVTPDISKTAVGLTIATDENGLVIYGTATATRYVGFLNGNNFTKATSDTFTKTIGAGTYFIDFQMTGAQLTGGIRGTYTTFNDNFTVITTVDDQPHSKQYTFTGNTMLGFQVVNNRNYGTSESPTRIAFRVYGHSAYDDVAREAASALYPADKKLETAGKAADAEATGLYISDNYNVLADIVKGFPESPQTYEVGNLSTSDGSKTDNDQLIRTVEGTRSAIQRGDVVISDGTYNYRAGIYDTKYNTSSSFITWITETSYTRPRHCTAIPDEYIGKYVSLVIYNGGETMTAEQAASMTDHIKIIHTGYNKLGYERLLDNNDDVDDIKHPGVYRWNTDNYPANLPRNKAGVLLVAGTTAETYTSQLIIYSDGEIASRYNDNGTWGAFYQSESKFEHFLDRCGRIRFTPKKGSTNATGGRTSTSACLTTGLIDCANYDRIKIVTYNNVYCNVLQGSTTSLRRTNTWINSGIINKDSDSRYIAVNMYLVADDGTNVDWQVADFDLDVVVFGEQNHYEFKNDVPESCGVFNAMRRAYQMADIEFTALAAIPWNESDKPAGSKIKGVLYSSVWNKMNGFVPQTVSFHTYMTAAKDPDSMLYTEVGGGDIRRPYYGCVCSTTVAYCIGASGLLATVSIPNHDDFEVLDIEYDNASDLRLGDILVSQDEHVVIITGISRNQYGVINSVEITEGTSVPHTRRIWIPVSGITTGRMYLKWYFDNNYIPCRYKYINKVKYQADPWVNVLTETGTPTYPTTICPNKGDRSIYSPSEHVIIDLLDTSASTGTLSDGTTSTTVPLSDTSVDLGTLSGGKWTFTVGSESVSFIVVDVTRTVTPVGEKTYNVAFTNDNPLATPLNISIHHPTNHGCSDFHVLTAEEIENGSAVVSHTSTNGRAISVCYTTEYGWYYDGFTDVE